MSQNDGFRAGRRRVLFGLGMGAAALALAPFGLRAESRAPAELKKKYPTKVIDLV